MSNLIAILYEIHKTTIETVVQQKVAPYHQTIVRIRVAKIRQLALCGSQTRVVTLTLTLRPTHSPRPRCVLTVELMIM